MESVNQILPVSNPPSEVTTIIIQGGNPLLAGMIQENRRAPMFRGANQAGCFASDPKQGGNGIPAGRRGSGHGSTSDPAADSAWVV